MRKIIPIFTFLMICTHLSAQFNTIRKTPKIYEVKSANVPSNTTHSTQPETSSKGKEETTVPVRETIITDSLRQQYIMQYMSVSYPLKEIRINSPFGFRNDPFTGKKKAHNGLDLHARTDEVYAMFSGTVKKAGYDKRSGNYIILQHGEYTISYCHLSQTLLRKGNSVNPGDVVGITGNTGRSTGEHLHITCKRGNKYIDPVILIQYIKSAQENALKLLCKNP